MTLKCIHGHNINDGESTCEDGHSIHEPAAAAPPHLPSPVYWQLFVISWPPKKLESQLGPRNLDYTRTPQELQNIIQGATISADKLQSCARCHTSTGHTSISTATSQHQKARATYN